MLGVGRLLGIPSFGQALVLRRFRIDRKSEDIVDIIGRKPGIVAWMLTVLGLDTETSLRVTRNVLYFKSSSLFGTTYNTVPLSMVSSTHCGYTKSPIPLVLSILLALAAIFSRSGFSLILLGIAAVFLIGYVLSKQFTIYLETSGGMLIGLSFKRSVIENVKVDMGEALEVTKIVNHLVLMNQSKGVNGT